MGVDLGAVLGRACWNTRAGLLGERAAGVDAVAQAGDVRASDQFLDGAVAGVDVGDEQAGGVGPDVDDGDAHGRGS